MLCKKSETTYVWVFIDAVNKSKSEDKQEPQKKHNNSILPSISLFSLDNNTPKQTIYN